ncbi:MAG: O-acetyl-ADP-ribose deacetylase [Thermoplasmata archaeon]|nr:MAG: O-acetyl-ADP-ribose deacetylase [Thermoplasmata archaeon]
MQVKIGNAIFEIIKGDITKQEVDAIVNAANPRLTPGGGVSGAIHKAAGKELWEECKKLGGCKTGEAKITKGYKLKAKYVIHTVGPVYKASPEDEKLLASCYINSLKLALQHGIKSIAFPAISTGVYGYPMEEAAKVAIKTIMEFLRENEKPELVRLVLYDNEAYEIHKKVMEEIIKEME